MGSWKILMNPSDWITNSLLSVKLIKLLAGLNTENPVPKHINMLMR